MTASRQVTARTRCNAICGDRRQTSVGHAMIVGGDQTA